MQSYMKNRKRKKIEMTEKIAQNLRNAVSHTIISDGFKLL